MFSSKFALMMLVSGVCAAGTFPISGPVAGEQGFSTLDQAAEAGLQAAVKVSTKVEEAGSIYQLNGKFYYTQPATNAVDAKFEIRIAFPVGAKFVALFHTHPDYMNNNMFSPGDIDIANQLHVTSYVGVISGIHSRIIKFVPGVTKLGSCDRCGEDPIEYFHRVSYGITIASLNLNS